MVYYYLREIPKIQLHMQWQLVYLNLFLKHVSRQPIQHLCAILIAYKFKLIVELKS